MAALALRNFLRLKSRDSYTPKGSVDEIQNNGSLLQGEWRKNSRESRYRKMTLIFRKNSNIITGVCQWTRKSPLVFKGSIELSNSGNVLMIISFGLVKYNLVTRSSLSWM